MIGVAALRKARKTELLDRNMLCIARGRLTHYGGSCSSVSRLSASLRPRAAGLAALTPAARELESSYGDRSRACDAGQISAFSDDWGQRTPRRLGSHDLGAEECVVDGA